MGDGAAGKTNGVTNEVHPFVEVMAHHLMATTKDPLTKLVLTDVGRKKAEELLRSVIAKPAEFQRAVQALAVFVEYLNTDRESPQAGSALLEILQRLVAEAGKANFTREIAQREAVGERFQKFTAKKPASADDLPQGGPVISARDLLRGKTKI